MTDKERQILGNTSFRNVMEKKFRLNDGSSKFVA